MPEPIANPLAIEIKLLHDAQIQAIKANVVVGDCIKLVIEAAKCAGVAGRAVAIIDKVAYYIDPPDARNSDWSVTFGSPPIEVTV